MQVDWKILLAMVVVIAILAVAFFRAPSPEKMADMIAEKLVQGQTQKAQGQTQKGQPADGWAPDE